jgi:Zn-dependent protease with chaperone function
MRWRDGARRRLGDVLSTLLIMIGTIGLVMYLLYMRNPNNATYYALTVLIISGGFLAIVLAALYLTKGVEPQGGIE